MSTVSSRARSGVPGRRLAAALLPALLLMPAGPAAATPPRSVPGGDPLVIAGAPASGPARYDRVFVTTYGPRDAGRVLVLVPGLGPGAGSFRLIAPEIARRVPDLQVWTVDARTQAFEDPRGFETGDPDAANAYYTEGSPIDGRTFTSVDGSDVPFVRRWGLETQLEDVRRVVLEARAGGRRSVILGGHSNGGAAALAYATWDFAGRAGHRDLAGLVVIDGGLLGTNPGNDITLVEARRRLAEIRRGDPFWHAIGPQAPPWLTGVLNGSFGILAATRPDDAAPAGLQELLGPGGPPFPITNEALLGTTFTVTQSAVSGTLAPAGDPRPWDDTDALSPVARLAAVYNGQRPNSDEWYIPARRVLDMSGAERLRRTPVADLLGLRTWHHATVDIPLYAFATAQAPGAPADSGVLHGARAFVDGSEIRHATLDSDDAMLHFDPLYARPESNTFLRSVVPFLRTMAAPPARTSAAAETPPPGAP